MARNCGVFERYSFGGDAVIKGLVCESGGASAVRQRTSCAKALLKKDNSIVRLQIKLPVFSKVDDPRAVAEEDD